MYNGFAEVGGPGDDNAGNADGSSSSSSSGVVSLQRIGSVYTGFNNIVDDEDV